MIRALTAEDYLKRAVFLILLLIFCLEIASGQGMFADSSNMLVGMLESRDFLLFERHRLTHGILTQLPVVLAMQAGVTSLGFYFYLYAGLLVFFPFLFWALSLVTLRDDALFWPFTMLFCFVFYNTGFSVISESCFCYALTACALACLLKRDFGSRFDKGLLLVTAALYPCVYAATLFFGPILTALALYRRRREGGRRMKIYWLVLALFFAAGFGTGLWEVLTPRDPNNFANARNIHSLLLDQRYWLTLFYSLCAAGLFFAAERWSAALLVACFVLLGLLVMTGDGWAPFSSYTIRLYMALSMVPCCLLLIWMRYGGQARRRGAAWRPGMPLAAAVFAVFLLLSYADAMTALAYMNYLHLFRTEVNAKSGYVPLEKSSLALSHEERLFGRPWTHPLMSLLLRRGSDRALILNPAFYAGSFQGYCDPPHHVPDFSLYYGERR